MGWVKKHCCWFPASMPPGGVALKLPLPASKGKCFVELRAKGSGSEMPSRESQLAWTAALLCVFVPSGMCRFSKWQHRACPVPGGAPGLLSLCWLFSRLEWLHWLNPHYPQGEARRLAGGRKIRLSHGLCSSRFWVFLSEHLMEFYSLSVWKFGQNSQQSHNFCFWKKFQLDVNHHRILLEWERTYLRDDSALITECPEGLCPIAGEWQSSTQHSGYPTPRSVLWPI